MYDAISNFLISYKSKVEDEDRGGICWCFLYFIGDTDVLYIVSELFIVVSPFFSFANKLIYIPI